MDLDPLRRPGSAGDGATGQSPSGWFPDPQRRFELRWFNGERWTADVASDGVRYIDPGRSATPHGRASVHAASSGRHPSRTLAVLSLVLGLAALALAWAPFVFVFGAAGAIAALVLGTVSLRRTARLAAAGATIVGPPGSNDGSGRRMAIAGICLGPLGLGLCVVGVILTDATYREFHDYVRPGAHRITGTTCTLDGTRATYSGTITNLDDRTRDYELLLHFLDGTRVAARDRVIVDDVEPGASAQWSSSGRVGAIDLRCRVWNVTGPYPFGLDPLS